MPAAKDTVKEAAALSAPQASGEPAAGDKCLAGECHPFSAKTLEVLLRVPSDDRVPVLDTEGSLHEVEINACVCVTSTS